MFAKTATRHVFSILLAILLLAGPALAAEKKKEEKKAGPPKITFMGVEVVDDPGLHMVTKDANVRAKPGTKAKKVSRFDKGTRIRSKGHLNAWLAVLGEDGKDLGFVYAPITMPLIDGMLSDDIRAQAQTSDGVVCDYNVHFEGKSLVDGVPFQTADYEVWFRCFLGAEKLVFPTTMFLTEGPYQMTRKGPFQITLDVPQVAGDEYEELLSVTMLYDADKDEVRFEGVSIKDLAKKPKDAKRSAEDLPRVLATAVEMVLASWSKKTLGAISKNL